MTRSLQCTNCFPSKPISGAEQGSLKELENEYVALHKRLHPMSAGFDYGSLSNIHTIEFKSTQFNQVYQNYWSFGRGTSVPSVQGRVGASRRTNHLCQQPLWTVAAAYAQLQPNYYKATQMASRLYAEQPSVHRAHRRKPLDLSGRSTLRLAPRQPPLIFCERAETSGRQGAV